jgi:hypothetical protein
MPCHLPPRPQAATSGRGADRAASRYTRACSRYCARCSLKHVSGIAPLEGHYPSAPADRVKIPFACDSVCCNRALVSGPRHPPLTDHPRGPLGKVPSEVTLQEAQRSARLATRASFKAILAGLRRPPTHQKLCDGRPKCRRSSVAVPSAAATSPDVPHRRRRHGRLAWRQRASFTPEEVTRAVWRGSGIRTQTRVRAAMLREDTRVPPGHMSLGYWHVPLERMR